MSNAICSCAFCRQPCFEGQALVDNPIFNTDLTLDYIEIAHRDCAPQWVRTPEEQARLDERLQESEYIIQSQEEADLEAEAERQAEEAWLRHAERSIPEDWWDLEDHARAMFRV